MSSALEKSRPSRCFRSPALTGAATRHNQQLQRVYGTAFTSKEELAAHLARLEEAKRRDHRLLGKQLDLFSVDELVGPGFVLWHPKGAILRLVLEDMIRKEVVKRGYQAVYTPHVAREQLLEKSGHLAHYKDNLFGGMELEGQRYLVKPMNCPFHVAIYRSQLRSYRELPIRYSELGTVYRYERSGVLHGLLRVRGFTQDDAHLFITEDQIEAELDACVRFGMDVLRLFGFEDVKFFMSTRPKDFMGEIEAWNKAEAAIRRVLEATGHPFEVDEGGGAFYGPKIDLKIRDALGREWQCTTFQLDYQMPERFGLEYVASDGFRKRPIMIHRALLGSIERFIAVLIEHFAGAFPMWLAPVQARVISVSEKAEAYAREAEGVSAGSRPARGRRYFSGQAQRQDPACPAGKDSVHVGGGRARHDRAGGFAAHARGQAVARDAPRRHGQDLGCRGGGSVAGRHGRQSSVDDSSRRKDHPKTRWISRIARPGQRSRQLPRRAAYSRARGTRDWQRWQPGRHFANP